MTRGKLNFMEEMEAHEDIGLIVGFLGYTLCFPLLFGFITIGSCKYLFVYIY